MCDVTMETLPCAAARNDAVGHESTNQNPEFYSTVGLLVKSHLLHASAVNTALARLVTRHVVITRGTGGVLFVQVAVAIV